MTMAKITSKSLDLKMSILDDIKKVIKYNKHTGMWAWQDRDDETGATSNGNYKSFIAAVNGAVDPYI
jgi:hypothetical protein